MFNLLKTTAFVLLLAFLASCANTLDHKEWKPEMMFNWKFSKGKHPGAMRVDYDDSGWKTVHLPHDWAIIGPFGDSADNGNTGKLPWKGQGWYRKSFHIPDSQAEEELPDETLLEHIREAIDQMPPQRRKIFKMGRFEGLKYKEIASSLGISPKTVEVQMGKALKTLREMFDPEQGKGKVGAVKKNKR